MATVPIAGAVEATSSIVGRLNVPEAPPFARGVRLTAPGGMHPIRRIPFDWIRKNIAYTETIEAVAEIGLTGPVLWTDRTGWLRVSVAGGGFQAVGDTRATGVNLGAFTAKQRKSLELEITVPPAAEVRTEFLPLNLAIGADY